MEFTVVDIDQVTARSINNLEDLSVLLDCEVFDKFKHTPADILKDPFRFIGKAEKAVITEKNTQIIALSTPEENHRKKIEKKVKDLENTLRKIEEKEEDEKNDDFEKYELKRRLSNYKNSTAVLYIGGKTLQERMTRERLFDDSIFACKSALKSGIIPGGNILIPKILKEKKEEIAKVLAEKYFYFPLEDINLFFLNFLEILKKTFLESYSTVLNNSYLSEDDCEKIIEKCLSEKLFYNLKTHSYENLEKTSIINSAETDIQILKSCVSIIGILATSNQFITLNFNVTDNIKKK